MNRNRRDHKQQKLAAAHAVTAGAKLVPAAALGAVLSAVIHSHDRICVEGDNQKQADFLSRALLDLDPAQINELHLLISTIGLPEQLDLFEMGLASRIDFAYAGSQGNRMARMIRDNQIQIGNIHTYNELYSRYFMELRPHVCLLCGVEADAAGNLYMSGSVEDSPTIAEATAFSNGIVIAQVNRIVERVRRVDIPGDWVDFVVEAPSPFHMDPLFTRDPAQITESMILMAMLTMKGIYAKYLPRTLNHGVGFNTAAIELMLPTYGESLGLKGRALSNWVLNPHPTMIPAIEEGWVESIIPPGSELGMEHYVEAHPNIFPVGADGSLHSNRLFAQLAGHYACDIFVGASLQIDAMANSSTVTSDRIAGFGGAPNFGCDAGGRRHTSDAWLMAGREYTQAANLPRGRKLVVQVVETFQNGMHETFVEKLDAAELAEHGVFELPPIMIYGEDVSHIVTEEGIANLLLCRSFEEREQAVRGVAGYTSVGRRRDKQMVESLRQRGIIQRPEDLGICKLDASRDLLAARNIKDLVKWSGGLYDPPARFRNW